MRLVAIVSEPDPPPEPPAAAGEFAQVYDAHVDRVHARLTRLVGPIADREDLLQQTFLQVFRALPRFRGDAAIGTFVHRIAVNVAIDYLRAKARRPAIHDSDAVAEMVAPGLDPHERAAAREELSTMFALLAELTPENRAGSC